MTAASCGSYQGPTTGSRPRSCTPGSHRAADPRRHRHPHAEIFVLHGGKGRYKVEGTSFDAEAGDIVIVPPDAWHSFLNTGDGPLQQTAIHQNPRAVTIFEDGSSRD